VTSALAALKVTVSTIAYIGTTPPNGTDVAWPTSALIILYAQTDLALSTVVGGFDGGASLMAQRIA
jgi:hypothetical protein